MINFWKQLKMEIKIKDIKIGKRFRNNLEKIKELSESINETGLIVPIVIDKDNKLVDGERRMKAFKLLKRKDIPFTRYPEYNVEAEASANTGMHWNVIEAVSIWNAMEKPIGGRGKTRSDSEQVYDDKPIKRAAKITSFSHDTLSKAKYILDEGSDDEKQKLQNGSTKVNKLYSQIKARKDIEDRKKKEAEKKAEEDIKESPKEEIQVRESEATEENSVEEPSDNKTTEETPVEEQATKPEPQIEEYQIIYADPPWKYNRNVGEGIASEEYSLMSNDKIASYLSDNKIHAEEDSMLFLWVTFPMLKEGLEVLNSWGFEYKTCGFNWIKLNKNGKPFFGIGHYTKSNSELCLIGIKGKGLIILDDTISQIVMTEKDKHSKKPEEIPELIVRLVGDRKRVELFARKKREGWDVYGDEV